MVDFDNLYDKISEKLPDEDDKGLLKELIKILQKDGSEQVSENLDERIEKFGERI